MGVDGSLHFSVPYMNRLNQTEPATFSIVLCWTFFRDSYFSLYIFYRYGLFILNQKQQKTRCRCNIFKCAPHIISVLLPEYKSNQSLWLNVWKYSLTWSSSNKRQGQDKLNKLSCLVPRIDVSKYEHSSFIIYQVIANHSKATRNILIYELRSKRLFWLNMKTIHKGSN
jgi:hypothetical protein